MSRAITDKMLALARLGARETTPEHERKNAAFSLCKLVEAATLEETGEEPDPEEETKREVDLITQLIEKIKRDPSYATVVMMRLGGFLV